MWFELLGVIKSVLKVFSKLLYVILNVENGFGEIWCLLGVYPLLYLNLVGIFANSRRRWPWGATAEGSGNAQ